MTSYFQANGLPGGGQLPAGGRERRFVDEHQQWRLAVTSLTGVFSNFSTADGLPGNDLTGWNACSRNAQGEMYFGGFAGATVVRPDAPVALGFTPPVLTRAAPVGRARQPGTPPLDGPSPMPGNSIAPDVTDSRSLSRP